MDLIISGNITKDLTFDIYNNFSENITLGGITNFWYHFQSINNKYVVRLNPLSYGESVILIDKKTCNRYNKSQLNIIKNIKNPALSSKWYHMMYINQLSEFNENFLKNINSKIISADLCGGVENKLFDVNLLKYIDFLFCSKEDIDSDIKINNIRNYIKGYIILHENNYYKIISNVNKNIEIDLELSKEKKLKNINVLGAGDYFAASFVFFMLDKDINDINSIQSGIEFSQNSVLKTLKTN